MEQIDEDVFFSLLANDVTGTNNKHLVKNIGAIRTDSETYEQAQETRLSAFEAYQFENWGE